MNNNEGGLSCVQGCWALALGASVIIAALLMIVGDWRLLSAMFGLVVLTIILGALLSWFVCLSPSAPGQLPWQAAGKDSVPPPVSPREESPPAAAAQARDKAEPARETPAPETSAAAAPNPEKSSPAKSSPKKPSAEKPGMKPSKELAGEAELASRKGTWKYQDEDGSRASAPKPASKPAAASATAPGTANVSNADAPERLNAARESGPDDLKRIKGVGPKLETLLNSMGFFHFDQIASWTGKEVAWVDENLEGFKGRVTRDNWVDQARTLAKGGSIGSSGKG